MNQDAVAYAKVKLEELLAFFGINAEIEISEEDDRVNFDVKTTETGRLIGHHGETLRSLQYLLNQMVSNHIGERVFVGVDIAGYKKGRAETLAAKAKTAAEEVASTGKSQEIGPLNAAERRVVHMAISEVEGVESGSTGMDPHRRVVITKKGEGEAETS